MTDELKPCAHCNHDAKFMREIQMSPESPVLGYILCPNCGMRTGCMLLYSEATAAWNIRHEPEDLPEWAIEAIEKEIENLWNKHSTKTPGIHAEAMHRLRYEADKLRWVLSLRKPEEK